MTKAQFDKVLAKYGATLDIEMLDADMLQVDAPRGQRWIGNGCHTICIPFKNVCGQSWKPQAYADAAETMNHGIEACDAADCDMCEDN